VSLINHESSFPEKAEEKRAERPSITWMRSV